MDSERYWAGRAERDKARQVNLAEKYISSRLRKHYTEASIQIQKDIEEVYKQFADEYHITLAEAKKLIRAADFEKMDFDGKIQELREAYEKIKKSAGDIPDEILSEMEERNAEMEKLLDSYSRKGEITRLELINTDVQKEMLKLYDRQQTDMLDLLKEQYTDSYYRKVFETQQMLGFGRDFASLNAEAVKKAVMTSYNRKNFSQTIWGHCDTFAKDIKENIVTGLIRGENLDKMSKRISDRMDVSFSNAKRLVRTETAYVVEKAAAEAYAECDIEKYEYIATLDYKTNAACQELDGKIFLLKDAVPGKNYPPMHPNCRSTTGAYFDNKGKTGTRTAKGSDGSYYDVPADMTYKQWHDSLGETEQGRMKLMNKMDKNRNRDKEALAEYKKISRNGVPSLARYQEMKYNDTEEYRILKGYKRAVEKGDISPLIGLKLYNKTANEIRETFVGMETANGTTITGFSIHFIDRVLGQKKEVKPGTKDVRLGVDIKDAYRALKYGEVGDIKERKNDLGEMEYSQLYKVENCSVSVNPYTGNLIQLQPQSSRKGDKT